ncbi:MAG: helix-turn-helix transcriptional regulator [Proteobacteria bacterium]|nr:helix-turn-helix transcriptional regulator [Pseudomonadota bacterium]
MAFLSSTRDVPAVVTHDEPFRFARALPLILTKLSPPRSPGALVQRDRLLQQLDGAASRNLTLVCAAAGFGKTTLLAQWYHRRLQRGDSIAWLNLEEDDNSPLLFMRYLQAALRPFSQQEKNPLSPGSTGELAGDFAHFCAALINLLHTHPRPLYLILDDYQYIQHPSIHTGLSWLLAHAPACLHLVLGSRCPPPWALSRLQIEDQLLEIDDDALRFTHDEAHAWFSATTAIPVKKETLHRLISVTEGWIAGMKMAALAPPGHTNNEGSLRASSRSVSRYLDEVVFAPLPADVFDFLLRTSLLNRLHPALCDAVTGLHNGVEMLAWIAERNLFLSTLDDEGFWFRYHPLMRDALFTRLQRHGQQVVSLLHERASTWFAAQQLWAEAIRHTLAAGKPMISHAAAGAQSLAEEGDIDTMVRWMRYLPADVTPARIELQINLAWALAHYFRFDDARQLLDELDALAAKNPALAHPGRIKLRVVRAICEAFAENIAASLAIVEPLLQAVPCGDIWVDGLVCNILSYCYLVASRPQQALAVHQRIAIAQTPLRNLFVEVYRAFVMAQACLRQGDLTQAEQLASRALCHAEQHTGTNSSSSATLAPLLAEIAWEQGNDERLEELLTLRLQTIDDVCPPDGLSSCYRVLARNAQQNNQHQEAQALLQHAEQLADRRGWLRIRALLLAEQLALYLLAGHHDAAEHALVQLLQIRAADPHQQALIDRYSAISQCRMLIAHDEPLAAARLLHIQVEALEQCGEWLSAVRLRLLEAIALFRGGEIAQAATVGLPALQSAVAKNLRRSLQDLGPDLTLWLVHLNKQPTQDMVIRTLLSQLGAMLPAPATAGLRLTEREQQTLRLIADGHSNKQIARALGISVETVKWHLKQLYEKLQVKGRIQAVNQARKQQLLH